ncbi:transmembrane amino acid transporter protein-domain-containing protein, partial [Pilobolus umbonatus]
INLANTILGTGMLAMPAAVASVGLVPGIFIILFNAFTSGSGLYLLTQCADQVNGKASFNALSKLTYPRLAVVMASFVGDDIHALLIDRRFWITVYMILFILPLSFLKRLDSLKYTSIIALIAAVYLCVIVVYYYVWPVTEITGDQVEYFHITSRIFKHIPIFIFAFTCHQNIFTVYNELKDHSERVMSRVITVAIGCSALVYESIAVIGYLSFGKSVRGNIIVEYPSNYFVAGGRLAIVILVMFGYSLQAHPCRSSVDNIIKTKETSPFKYYVMTTTILILSYLVAISVTHLETILTFVGSTGSTIISFILPGLFYYRLHASWSVSRINALLLSIYGLIIMTVCLSFNLLELM